MHRAGLPPINTQEEEEATSAVRVLHRCRAHPQSVESSLLPFMLFLTLETPTTAIWTTFQLQRNQPCFGLDVSISEYTGPPILCLGGAVSDMCLHEHSKLMVLTL